MQMETPEYIVQRIQYGYYSANSVALLNERCGYDVGVSRPSTRCR